MGTSFQGAWQGGRRPKGVKGVLHCCDTGYFALWVGNVGVYGEDGKGPGQFSVQGREEDHGGAAAAKEGRELALPTVGGSNEGDRDGSDTGINTLEVEYGRAIHCDAADSGPV